MFFGATALLIAQQPRDTSTAPPFWWIGLFASPGGLIILSAFAALIIMAILSVSRQRAKERRAHERGKEEETANGEW